MLNQLLGKDSYAKQVIRASKPSVPGRHAEEGSNVLRPALCLVSCIHHFYSEPFFEVCF